jgi:hypothetical protein
MDAAFVVERSPVMAVMLGRRYAEG